MVTPSENQVKLALPKANPYQADRHCQRYLKSSKFHCVNTKDLKLQSTPAQHQLKMDCNLLETRAGRQQQPGEAEHQS